MNRARVGIVLVLLGSLVLGTLAGVVFHRLFMSNVPDQWLSEFQAKVTPFAFIGTGLLFGLAIGVWSLLVAWVAPSFRGGSKSRTRPPGSDIGGT